MEDDSNFPAAERIISDIDNIFKRDQKLNEFAIISVTLNENRSPVIVENLNLGLESWCVKHVYFHSYKRLMAIRHTKWKREDPNQVIRLLTTALLLNPDVSTFWNMRRELVLEGHINQHAELHYTSVILSRKPKSPDVFSYRKWVIKNLLKDFPSDPGLITNEFHVSELAANRYPNNYHTWNHRLWCLDQLSQHLAESVNLLATEWLNSKKWISTHVSDHSGFQYRQQLMLKFISCGGKNIFILKRTYSNLMQSLENSLQHFLNKINDNIMLKETKNLSRNDYRSRNIITFKDFVLAIISSELILNSELILLFIGHETLWYHRRFLIFTFHDYFIKNNFNYNQTFDLCKKDWRHRLSQENNDGVPLEKNIKIDNSSSELMKLKLLANEEELLKLCSNDLQQSKAALKHKVWMENVLKISLP